jgi:hypothetical protein
MKLPEHVENIRQLIDKAFRNRLGRMGILDTGLIPIDQIPNEYRDERTRMENILEVLVDETGSDSDAYEKLVEELTFTLFNRIAAMKVMEAHTLHPEIITRRETHGGRSFAHLVWLEQNPGARAEESEGLMSFFEEQLEKLKEDIPLFSPQHPYHLLPTTIELLRIIEAFNKVDNDSDLLHGSNDNNDSIWESDDILGWLYESYNEPKKAAHKASGGKTEYNKVNIQSQWYTPRWVVQFLVDNSLGKLYLEMYPDSEIKHKYKIANAPTTRIRKPKPLQEIKLIDPATGSGNFLLYAFDLFYDLYLDQIENYGADYDEADIPLHIIEHNLHGVDLDDRAVQLAQLGLYIKAKRKRRMIKIDRFNVVSSDFYLPDYDEVRAIFEENSNLDAKQKKIIAEIWTDLQQAYKFGSLIRLEEKLSEQLHGLQEDGANLFLMEEMENYGNFREQFFNRLQNAVTRQTERQGITFLNAKTQDAITFLQLLTQKYDVAVANPPYTDSADFGPELKKFVEANYKQPYKFNTNLYAVFIKRCFELTTENGKMALIHPLTFMYIKTFEDVRKFILEKTHISVFVDYGLSNLFGAVMVDPAFYVLEKENDKQEKSWFISLDQYTRTPNEKFKKDYCLEALDDSIANRPNKHNITLPQEKLKIIEGWPFIYWISDGFREKFKGERLNDKIKVCSGLSTANNDRFLRFWWEIGYENIYQGIAEDKRKWVLYCKGGPYKKWSGNLWVVVNYQSDGSLLRDNGGTLRNKDFYFKEGITCSGRSSSKGVSYRYFPNNHIFDVGATGLIPINENSLWYGLGFMNSKLTTYILDCLNPTVNTTEGDLQKVPFIVPADDLFLKVELLSKFNTEISFSLLKFRSIETSFEQSPLFAFQGAALKDRVLAYLNFENVQHTQVLINEAIINELIFEVYELSDADREQVEAKMGKSIGQLPIANYELGIRNGSIVDLFIEEAKITDEVVLEHLRSLPLIKFEPEKIREIKEGFATLYQSNNDLEEFCIRHQVNPINVWYWFKEAQIVPAARAAEIALEFLADSIRTLLQQDEDGIIPLVGLPGEEALSQRLEQHCLQNGFTAAQYMQLDALLGRPINEYLEHHFFNQLSNRLNLFMYLPKTPFIWHLSSGQQQGFEAYILIYKWNRDSLFKLKSQYISHRVQNLEYRQIQLQDVNTAQAQAEKEKIRLQLQEIETFKNKIDELIAEGYDPKLDDGVGKNIAPLQKKGLLRAEVLKTTGRRPELERYLNADW